MAEQIPPNGPGPRPDLQLPAYQWQFEGLPLAGRVAPTLTLPNVAPEQAGRYDVVLSNSIRVITSQPAMLEVVTNALSIGSGARWANGEVHIGIDALEGRRYWLQYKDDLSEALWRELPPVTATGGWLILTNAPDGARQRFYRIREE